MPLNVDEIMSIVKSNIGDGMSLVNGDAIAAQAAADLADCINVAMSNSLVGNEMSAVGTASSSGASYMGGGNYQIGANIDAQFRYSLLPDIYGGVNDMAALFNNGYSAHPLIVYEIDGTIRRSRPSRSPAHFVQSGLQMFAGRGGGKYEVISTQPSSRFT